MTDTPSSGNAESAESADNGADKYMVPALERGLRLLQEFGRGNATLGAPELARRLQLPRATIFRMLNTLEAMGFLQRADGSNDYRLGLSVLRLGFEFLSSMDLTELGQPVIARLCGEIRYPCNIVVRDGRSIVYVAKVTPPTPLTSSVRVGTRLPAHATALGRVLLADLSLPELRTLYPEEHLEAHTPKTPRTVLDLFNLVEADRERGHVFSEGFYESSICTIAAPVRDHSGRVVAALGTTVPAPHVEEGRAETLIAGVCDAAAELSELLNYRPQTQTQTQTQTAQLLSLNSRRAGGGHV
ncbi:IclR family transcriptional regulator [Delftia sp. 60]|uniref:IclR family transcriptional regulator n=1 Tax=Delftia sp. 60 TaxID=2035216 RepID=UPI000C181080|nr:IclR family transcriptional regulator [Delftia sp. 60]PIF40153.1 IclR family transcriptional regulator [Burkholderiales bacterium 23]PIF64664.1 IclR family transcriptional regulator [Delftia sp. 60]